MSRKLDFSDKSNAIDITSPGQSQEYTITIYKNPIKLLRLDVVPEVEGIMQTRFQNSNRMLGGTNRLLNFPVQD